jgi:hypothetical protein
MHNGELLVVVTPGRWLATSGGGPVGPAKAVEVGGVWGRSSRARQGRRPGEAESGRARAAV